MEEAILIIKKHQGLVYGLYIEDLGVYLSHQAYNKPGVVYQVFIQLVVLKYDSDTIINVARSFIDTVTDATISHIARTTDGSILLNEVYKILKCVTLENQTKDRCMKITRGFATKESAVVKPIHKANDTAQPRKLTKAEITEYKGRAKRVEKFDEEIVRELPAKGTGFVAYNKDDTAEGLDQIGTKDTIERIINIAANWSSFPQKENLPSIRELQIGDISRPGGIDTKEHGTHQDGKIFDMRPLRKTQIYEPLTYSSPDYSLATKEFIRMVRKLSPNTTFLYDDPQIRTDSEFSSFVKKAPLKLNKKTGKMVESHNDHLHVIFPGGK